MPLDCQSCSSLPPSSQDPKKNRPTCSTITACNCPCLCGPKPQTPVTLHAPVHTTRTMMQSGRCMRALALPCCCSSWLPPTSVGNGGGMSATQSCNNVCHRISGGPAVGIERCRTPSSSCSVKKMLTICYNCLRKGSIRHAVPYADAALKRKSWH